LKKALFIFFVFLFSIDGAYADHIAGGEVSYTFLGNASTPNAGRYRITLKLYRDCDSDGAPLDPTVAITIYPTGSGIFYVNRAVSLKSSDIISLQNPDPCIGNPPRICYEIGSYFFDVTLPYTQKGYVVAFQRCCRIKGIFNMINSGETGVTYVAYIPGTQLGPSAPKNNTPKFKTTDTSVICANNYFQYDFGAKDDDGDELEYVFEAAYSGLSQDNPADTIAQPPAYDPVRYNFGFSAQLPLGPNVSIDPNTGMISGIAPVAGIYVVTVGVLEKRDGIVINRHRKDLHLKVANCVLATSALKPDYINCDGLSLDFKSLTTSPLVKTYDWDFGVLAATDDVSTLPSPSFTYDSPGSYQVRLITNKNEQCTDTVYTVAKVYPGFTRGFKVFETCKGIPYVFTDTSIATFGVVDGWRWNFGDPAKSDDTAITSIASYIYSENQVYDVSLIVSTSVGCSDTISTQINVSDKPILNITNDTLICAVDTLQLNSTGTGTFSWTPDYMISAQSASSPLVSPDIPTTYYVTLTQAPGCVNSDSVFVNVKSFVSLDAGSDTTICLGDSILLSPVTDGLTFSWSPAATVSDPFIKNPWVKPTESVRYALFSTIGKCQANDGFVVDVAPYPDAMVSNDTSICIEGIAQLDAFGGVQYFWYPGNTLDDQTLKNPIARPYQTTNYVVAVYGDAACPKPAYDTVVVTVIPPVTAFAGNDTVAVIGQPLQLLASGALNYSWQPTAFLSSPVIANPIARLNDDITYVVRVSTIEGCFAFDTVRVKIYKTPPEIFIPTAFTPNDDGLNDRLKPIPVGIASLVYFKVYNRFGELVFSTTEIGKGWDGVYKGRDQGNESFVWQAKGIDYLGNEVVRKGQTTLIR
jgi:gliding motility-associated-like protein